MLDHNQLPLADVNKSLWFPEQASSFAEGVDWVYDTILYISLVFFVGIVIALVWFAIKYHKKKGEPAESQTSHHTPLELLWSIGPSFLLVYMFVVGAISYLDMRTPPEGSYEIGVEAYKWGWTMDYGGGTYHPELHLLLDEPTKLSMRSSDVIHSLFIPAFRAKKDIVPGRYNYMWFKPTVASEKVSVDELASAKKETGTDAWDYDKYQFTPDGYRFFDLYCAEYCGKSHSEMQTVVVVHETQEELDAWIKEKASRPDDVAPDAWGKTLYNQRGCASCHSIDGSKRVGPSFKDLAGSTHALADGSSVTVDPNYIRESILEPKAKVVAGYNPVMPSYKGQLSDDDIDSIIAYLKTLAE
ncbi:cytochrome c oxidase subunit II [Crateriforma conspicua]|uniref:cytochrome c oxidase subunit II n=1 Tax=Crateriforma conspicua TaxID=2527996 RepID=UPI0011899544|nr:cytochrome c oxidase subunit II [Crateriforma conspicua]QDV62855.1 Cytochrome c oxidase subunit 2 precursor [Crateriforma conspicua]